MVPLLGSKTTTYRCISSATKAAMLLPSKLHFSLFTGRSRVADNTLGSPPAAGMTHKLVSLYISYKAFDAERRYAIHLPSGLHSGLPSAPVQEVSCLGVAPSAVSTIKMSVFS